MLFFCKSTGELFKFVFFSMGISHQVEHWFNEYCYALSVMYYKLLSAFYDS